MLLNALNKGHDSKQQIDSALAAGVVTAPALCFKLPSLYCSSAAMVPNSPGWPRLTLQLTHPTAKTTFWAEKRGTTQLSQPLEGNRAGNLDMGIKLLAAKVEPSRTANQNPKVKLSQPEYAYHILVQTYALWLAVAWKEKRTFKNKVQQKCLCRNCSEFLSRWVLD